MNRREFTKTTLSAVAGLAVFGTVAQGENLKSKKEKL